MNIAARCEVCGETFRLAELVDSATDGRCPRCGVIFAPSYTPVLDAAVHDLLAAAEALHRALWQVREVAPRLEIDVRGVAQTLETGRP